MHRESRHGLGEQGLGMLTVIMFIGLLGALVTAYGLSVQASIELRGAAARDRAGFYTAEAGLNVGITRFVNTFKENGLPEQDDFTQVLTLGRRTVEMTLAAVEGCSPCEPTVIPVGETFGGLNSVPYRYIVQSQSANPAGEPEALIGGEFDVHNIPIFQFLAFINDHLFIMPLPPSEMHGRLHTNSNLYLQTDTDLSVEDLPADGITEVQVTVTGDLYRGGRKYDSSWLCSGKVSVDKLEDVVAPSGDNDPRVMACQGSSPWSESDLAPWKGSMKTEVKNIVTPDVGIIARGSGDYWKKADLRVVLNLSAGRQVINFGAAALCPGALNLALPQGGLFPIEVQDADGSRNVAKTNALWRFMCERRGSIFYTELPAAFAVDQAPNDNTNAIADALDYNPPFGGPAVGGPNFGPDNRPPAIDNNDQRVFRRAGYDTEGDGDIDNNDRNTDVCPRSPNPAGARPAWIPAYCPWPHANPPLTSWYLDMDYRRGGFWNHREKQWMRLLNLNVRALIDWNEANGDVLFPRGDTSDGGLVFFLTVQGPDSGRANSGNRAGNSYGVRLFDSADLNLGGATFQWPPPADPTGLMIVSDQAIVIEGNYNAVHKYPAAIMGDAIYTLSQGWEVPTNCWINEGNNPHLNDRKSAADLDSGRRDVPSRDCSFIGLTNNQQNGGSFSGANDLVINAAWLFGLGPSTRDPDWYNGGLENFPKYIESWDDRTLNYRGSFVSLGQSQHKLNNWSCGSGDSCNIYDPPERDFDYEALYNQVEWLPPFTPKIVYPQQRLYTRFFK